MAATALFLLLRGLAIGSFKHFAPKPISRAATPEAFVAVAVVYALFTLFIVAVFVLDLKNK